MILLLRVSVLLILGEIACWALAGLAPRARPIVRGLSLLGAVLLPGISAIAPAVRVIRLPADGTWSVASALPSTIPAIGWLAAVWAIGALVSLAVVVGGQWRLQAWLRTAAPVRCRHTLRSTRRIGQRMGLRRVRLLRRPDAGVVPFTAGLLVPTIVLPQGTSRWPASRLESVLVHELEHVRRRDVAARLAAELACCAYWFHPMARWHTARLRVESELACDQAVLASGARPSRYASDLLVLATQAPMALGFSDQRTLSERVRSILGPARRGLAPGTWSRAAIAAIVLCLTAAIACYEPTAAPRPSAAASGPRAMLVGATSRAGNAQPGRAVRVTIETPTSSQARERPRKLVVCTTR